ncbi:Uncharacterised protein [Vibrio cholerae]|nr:Uncharacterised protein [Vibrio cholerae]
MQHAHPVRVIRIIHHKLYIHITHRRVCGHGLQLVFQ